MQFSAFQRMGNSFLFTEESDGRTEKACGTDRPAAARIARKDRKIRHTKQAVRQRPATGFELPAYTVSSPSTRPAVRNSSGRFNIQFSPLVKNGRTAVDPHPACSSAAIPARCPPRGAEVKFRCVHSGGSPQKM